MSADPIRRQPIRRGKGPNRAASRLRSLVVGTLAVVLPVILVLGTSLLIPPFSTDLPGQPSERPAAAEGGEASKPTSSAGVEPAPTIGSEPTRPGGAGGAVGVTAATVDSEPTGLADVQGTPTASAEPTGLADVQGTPTANTEPTGLADVQGTPTASAEPTPTAVPAVAPLATALALMPSATELPTAPAISPIPFVASSPTARPATLRANDPRVVDRLRGFTMPIRDARLPTLDGHLPGAPRAYRQDIHHSIDFYDEIVGVDVGFGTEVVVAQAGVVVRADRQYREVTETEMAELLERSRRAGSTPPEVLDRLEGRQVAIDHGDGISTRYNHLESIAPGIQPGVVVTQGQVIGTVGNSGTPEAAAGHRIGPHLDFEIVVGDHYLGWGLSVPETRRWLELIFQTN